MVAFQAVGCRFQQLRHADRHASTSWRARLVSQVARHHLEEPRAARRLLGGTIRRVHTCGPGRRVSGEPCVAQARPGCRSDDVILVEWRGWPGWFQTRAPCAISRHPDCLRPLGRWPCRCARQNRQESRKVLVGKYPPHHRSASPQDMLSLAIGTSPDVWGRFQGDVGSGRSPHQVLYARQDRQYFLYRRAG